MNHQLKFDLRGSHTWMTKPAEVEERGSAISVGSAALQPLGSKLLYTRLIRRPRINVT
jgi:hypothetical protein